MVVLAPLSAGVNGSLLNISKNRLELYRISQDQSELQECGSMHAPVLQRLTQALHEWQDSIEAKIPQAGTLWLHGVINA